MFSVLKIAEFICSENCIEFHEFVSIINSCTMHVLLLGTPASLVPTSFLDYFPRTHNILKSVALFMTCSLQ